MEKFIRLSTIAAPLRREGIDTDQIIPMRYLITASRNGLGVGLFADWRYLPDARPQPDFVLNQPRYRDARILVAGANFGCGSSREHAPWALLDFGIRAVIAPSFANIFFDNAGRNGILLVALPQPQVDRIMDALESSSPPRLSIELESQRIQTQDGAVYSFEIDARRKQALLQGLDAIGTTLQLEAQISAYQSADRERRPWIYR